MAHQEKAVNRETYYCCEQGKEVLDVQNIPRLLTPDEEAMLDKQVSCMYINFKIRSVLIRLHK